MSSVEGEDFGHSRQRTGSKTPPVRRLRFDLLQGIYCAGEDNGFVDRVEKTLSPYSLADIHS